jgi:hypothetical protein
VPPPGPGPGGGRAPVLLVIGCAAPPVLAIQDVVAAAVHGGWRTVPVLTPSAARWLASRLPALAALTGLEVRTELWRPGADPVPRPDAVLVVPATANTVNTCAAGRGDTLALGLLNSAVAKGLPTVVMTAAGPDRQRPEYSRSLKVLRSAGVDVMDLAGTAGEPGDPPSGAGFHWRHGLDRVTQRYASASARSRGRVTSSA